MSMQLNHRFVVPSSIEQTWDEFNDLEGLAPCFPGATLTSVEDDVFKGAVKVKLGPIALQYTGTGVFLERDESTRRVVIEAKGKDKRGNGTASAIVTAVLSPDPDGTAVTVDTDLNITGKPAQFGRGVIQDVSDKLLSQFVDCIAARLRPAEPPVGAPFSAEPATPSEPAPVGAAAEAPAAAAAEPKHAAANESADLNLLATVAPVIARRAGPYLLGLVVLVVVIRKLRRRR